MIEQKKFQETLDMFQVKRQLLVELLKQKTLGTLKIDIEQTIEELDDLITEFKETFADSLENKS